MPRPAVRRVPVEGPAVMRARNAAVRPSGLQGGAMRGVPVLARTADEEVVGLDDRVCFLPVRPVHALVVVPAMARRAGRVRP